MSRTRRRADPPPSPGDLGVSSERIGVFDGIEGTGTLASAQGTTDGETPTTLPGDVHHVGSRGPERRRRAGPTSRTRPPPSRRSTRPSVRCSPTRCRQQDVRPGSQPATLTGPVPLSGPHDRPLRRRPRGLRVPAAPRPARRRPRGAAPAASPAPASATSHWAAAVAGHVERGESVHAAVRREAAEEIGVSDVDLVAWCAMQRTGQGRGRRRAGRLLLHRDVLDGHAPHRRAGQVRRPAVVRPGRAARARRAARAAGAGLDPGRSTPPILDARLRRAATSADQAALAGRQRRGTPTVGRPSRTPAGCRRGPAGLPRVAGPGPAVRDCTGPSATRWCGAA